MEYQDWTTKKVDKFVLINYKIGQGAFGNVYKGFYADDENKLVAVKTIPITEITASQKMQELVQREITILQEIQSKHIVKLYDVARTSNSLYLFFEYCADGDLKQYLQKKEKDKYGLKLSEIESFLIFRQICDAFSELYPKKIIHRDIKPANILLHNGIAKISDFGFARHIESSMEQQDYYSRLGSPLYMSPQILEGKQFSSKCDIWSLGILFYEMLYGKTPFQGDNQIKLMKDIKNSVLKFPDRPKRNEQCKILIRKMLQLSEDDRISWEQLLKEPILQPSFQIEVTQQENDGELAEFDTKENQNYLQQNLVASYFQKDYQRVQNTNNGILQELKQCSDGIIEGSLAVGTSTTISKNDVHTSTITYGHVSIRIIDHMNEQKIIKSMMQIQQFILYERNIAFFFNFAIQKFILLFNQKIISSISIQSYYKVIYLLCKNQLISLQMVQNLLSQQEFEYFKNRQIWNKYKGSQEYKKAFKLIENDIVSSIKFFNIITEKIKQNVIQDDFQKIYNYNFVRDSYFAEQYQIHIKKTLDYLQNQGVKREMTLCIRYLIICQNPYSCFNKPCFDFNQFYEQMQNMDDEELQKIIKNK